MGAIETLKQHYNGDVLVFGHRGSSASAPMNTIPAFERTLAQGAHGIELDVQLSADSQPVVIHDFDVDATTDGTGAVAELSLAQLQELDAGQWFDPQFAGTRIPTLGEVFAAVGDKLIVNVEIKHFDKIETGIEKIVADTITAHGMAQRVIVSSFNPLVLKRMRRLLPDVPLGYLQSPETMAGKTQMLMGIAEYDARHLHYSMINEAQISFSRESKHLINAWTVNDPAVARRLKLMGVNGIITDEPDTILKAIR
jgi:glycerophosphoryl diester phosphodiesterase